MSLDIASLLSDAELNAAPYANPTSYFPGVLLKQLAVLDKEVCDLYQVTNPDRISIQGTPFTISLAGNLAGYTLPVAKSYNSFVWVNNQNVAIPVRVVHSETEFLLAPVHPAGIVRGRVFYPSDPFDLQWTSQSEPRPYWVGNGDQLQFRYMPEPPVYTSTAGCLYAPNEAYSYILASLTLQILLRNPATPPEVLQTATAARATALQGLYLMAPKRAGE